jgi:predicted phage terminase large subunit-like protein
MQQIEEPMSDAEAVLKGASDGPLFSKHFFPKTARQAVPEFHRSIWGNLLAPSQRFINMIIFRGGAKTSILRLFKAHRVGYGVSKTVMYIGASEGKAVQSTGWLLRQVQKNPRFARAFGLEIGSKKTPGEFELINTKTGENHWIIGLGIHGSVRGVNFDDYRPDLIIVDDVLTDENAASAIGRDKIVELVFGALRESLTPRSENPAAQLVLLNTPHDLSDLTSIAAKDPDFLTVKYGCWTHETEHLPVHQQVSIWPERYPSEELRQQKVNAIASNRYSIFAREKECILVTPETSDFRADWIKYYNLDEIPAKIPCVIAIDPVPPPTEGDVKKGMHRRDFEVIAVVGVWKNEYYVLEYATSQGHTPNWTVNTFFELAMKWRPMGLRVETTMYQRTLGWLLREEMKRRGRYYPLFEIDDKSPKHTRIVNSLQGPLSNGALKILPSMSDLASQITNYPNIAHDDIIDAVASGVSGLANYMTLDLAAEDVDEEDIPDLQMRRGAP